MSPGRLIGGSGRSFQGASEHDLPVSERTSRIGSPQIEAPGPGPSPLRNERVFYFKQTFLKDLLKFQSFGRIQTATMNTIPKPTRRGGARIGAGRRKVGRRSIVVRIKAEILEKLSPNAARLIRELVEDKLENE
jgi:hypothetical protein